MGDAIFWVGQCLRNSLPNFCMIVLSGRDTFNGSLPRPPPIRAHLQLVATNRLQYNCRPSHSVIAAKLSLKPELASTSCNCFAAIATSPSKRLRPPVLSHSELRSTWAFIRLTNRARCPYIVVRRVRAPKRTNAQANHSAIHSAIYIQSLPPKVAALSRAV